LLNHEPSDRSRARVMVVEDPATRALVEQVERLGPSEATILVLGETGTGKELVARHLHDRSRRAIGPFVAVNCGALTPSLIESELFGHERGAFTGALATRAGLFERASGGTLFLDEIGELPPSTQVALLRVLQEREVLRVGGRAAIPVDVRVVAATHRDLRAALIAGTFREDLFYRIAVATLSIPPLRRRPADILALADHFVSKHRETLGIPELTLSDDARAKLLAHDWPGNIRELENVVHLATLMRRSAEITAAELMLEGSSPSATPEARSTSRVAALEPSPTSVSDPDPELSLAASLDRLMARGGGDLQALVERVLYERAMHSARGNQLEAARRLGVSRNVVRARLIEHGLLRLGRRSRVAPVPLTAEAPSKSIRFGHQQLGVLASAAARESFASLLASAGAALAYTEHESGIEVVEAIARGEIDVGVVGEVPTIFAEAAGTEIVYLAAEPPAPEGQALVATARSGIRAVEQLHGRALAVTRGASSLYLTLRILEEANLGLGDVELVTLKPVAAWRAFSRGEIDAWVVWDPMLGDAVRALGAQVLRDGRGLAPHRVFYVAGAAWAAAQPSAAESVVEALRGCEPTIRSLGDDVVEEQHAIAETLRRWGFVRSSVDVRTGYLSETAPVRRAS
jgi:DNA-binding NtrC family response regulator/ABC-type nitrate/sulfonate/bicarbonate transport system substrate-binding protein